MEILKLDGSKLEPFERAAELTAALAYPGQDESENRRALAVALCALQIGLENKVERTNDPFIEPRFNAYAEVPATRAVRTLHRAQKNLSSRAMAAQMARPWLSELVTGNPHPPVEGVARFSAPQLAAHILGGADPTNFLRRVWKPSLRVLHIACAADLYAYDPAAPKLPFPQRPKPFGLPLDHPHFGVIADAAMVLQKQIASDERFAVTAEKMIWLEWID